MARMLKIDPQSAKPIFQQVIEAIETKVLTGEFAEGTFLPSVRDLAVDLAINPNTVARAFQQLQQNGAVEAVRGLGLRVKGLGNRDRENRRQELLQGKCAELVDASEALHFSWSEALDSLNRVKKGRSKWKPKAL